MAVADPERLGNLFCRAAAKISAYAVNVTDSKFPSGAIIHAPIRPIVRSGAKAQVIDSVVQTIIVQMPDLLGASQLAAQMRRHDKAMNKMAFASDAEPLVVFSAD